MSSRCSGSRDRESMSGVERSGSVLGITIIFAAITFAAVWLLTAALVHLLANVLGSLLFALLVTGVAAAAISTIIYFTTIRPRLHHAARQFQETYEIISKTTLVYRKAKDLLSMIFR
ncbi:MAG: hypothetical protein SNG35_02775 [Rikenellaceae bacterium]